MADETGAIKEESLGGKEGKHPPIRPGRKRRRPAEGFYAVEFTTEELADLASKANADDLDDEIALIKVIIRRKLQEKANDNDEVEDKDKDKETDFEAIRRLVNTLCRAIQVKYALSGKGEENLKEATSAVLSEVARERGIEI